MPEQKFLFGHFYKNKPQHADIILFNNANKTLTNKKFKPNKALTFLP
jgi:hypothetical protein